MMKTSHSRFLSLIENRPVKYVIVTVTALSVYKTVWFYSISRYIVKLNKDSTPPFNSTENTKTVVTVYRGKYYAANVIINVKILQTSSLYQCTTFQSPSGSDTLTES